MKKTYLIPLLLSGLTALALYRAVPYVHLYFKPIEVVLVAKSDINYYDSIFLKHLPNNQHKLIQWWQSNRQNFMQKHQIPNLREDGYFKIGIWHVDEGFSEDLTGDYNPHPYGDKLYEMACFDEIKSPLNCLDKSKLYAIIEPKSIRFSNMQRDHYVMNEDGEYVKKRRD